MGILPGRKISHTVSGYVAGDRSMNLLILYFVIGASIFSSFAFLGGPGWAYSRGAAAFYIIAYGTIGMIPMYFLGPKARQLGIKHGYVTQAELVSNQLAYKPLSIVLAFLSIVVFIPYLTLQMKGAGYILNVISEGLIPEWAGAAITYFVVMIYVISSGVMGVGWTNTFQGIFMLVIAWFLGLYLPYKLFGGIGNMFSSLLDSEYASMLQAPGLNSTGEPWNWMSYSSAVIISAIGFSVWPHYFMKNFAARSDKTIKLTVVLYPTFQLFLVPILIIGFTAILIYPGVAPADTILPHILTQIELPAVVIGLICAGTLSASMSSGDAILHAAASIGVRDGYKILKKSPLTDDQERRLIRIVVVALSLVSYYFAVISNVSIVALLLGSYGGVAQIFPSVFIAIYRTDIHGKTVFWGLIMGICTTIICLLIPELRFFNIHEGIWGLAANLLTVAVVNQYLKK